MSPRPKARPLAFLPPTLLSGLGVLLALSGCGNQIGDGCRSSIDCSIQGDRGCDISQPGGYCTIEACDSTSCPSESICVRFFPTRFLSVSCDPRLEDVMSGPDARNDCKGDEICLSNGLCAPRATERRYCALKCGGNGDCRGAYECRLLGTRGSEALDPARLGRDRFCAPIGE